MKIDKDTKLYFSIASKPGTFGSSLYNACFKAMDINAIYKPLKITPTRDEDLAKKITSLWTVASGISVSMPFKEKIYNFYPNGGDSFVARCRNANTAISPFEHEERRVRLFNTDIDGFGMCFIDYFHEIENAIIYGSGAVSKSIACSLELNEIPYMIIERKNSSFLKNISADLLINATPVGMEGIEDTVFTEEVVERYKFVHDVVVSSKDTNLIHLAKKLEKSFSPGWVMAREQFIAQFYCYFGFSPDYNVVSKTIEEMGYVG